MKKTVSKFLATMLILSLLSANVFADTAFTDVPENHWAYNEIQYFYDAVVLDGVGNGMFAPDDNVTREQFAKLISQIYGKTYYNYKSDVQTFCDVAPDRWSYNYIESVKEYLTGYYPQNGQAFFNPDGFATREDIAYALVKIGGLDKELSDIDEVLDKYEDSYKISYNLRKYVAIAIQAGLILGYEDNTIRPNEGITRAETAALLFRTIKRPVEDNAIIEKNEVLHEENNMEIKSIKITNIQQISGYDNVKGTINVLMGDKPFFKAEMKCFEGLLANVVKCNIELIEAEKFTNTEIHGTFKVMYDDVVKHNLIDGIVSLENGILTFNATGENYNLIAYTEDYVNKEEVKEENVPEKDKYIYYHIKEFDGKKADGALMLHYKDNEKFAEIPNFNVIVGDDIYEYSIVDVSKTSEDSISVKYTLKLNSDIVEENLISKFDNYAKKIGEYVIFDKITMQIIETEG